MRKGRLKESGLALAFLAPSLIIFGAFFFYPIGRIVYWGFYQQNRLGTEMRWVGWSQYQDVLTGEDFLDGLKTTLLYVVYTVPAGLILGIALGRHVSETPALAALRLQKDAAELRAYLDAFPNGAYAAVARARLQSLQPTPSARPQTAQPPSPPPPPAAVIRSTRDCCSARAAGCRG